MISKKYLIFCLIVGFLISLYVEEAIAGIAYSPRGNLYIWEPCQWPEGVSGHIPADVAAAVEDRVKNQDYTVWRYADNTANDDDIKTCTLANFKWLQYAGLLYVTTHGNIGFVAAAYRTTEAKVNDWIAGESNMEAVSSGYWGYYARVWKEWPANNWKAILDLSNAIVHISACHSTDGAPASFVDNCGGRVGFGYDASPSSSEAKADNEKLYGRMNGSLDGGTRRKAGQAYNAGGYSPKGFRMVGNGDATLCPAPDAVHPKGQVGTSGSGYIEFDTYMDDRIAATQALTDYVMWGNCTISNVQWVGNASGKYRITFNWSGAGGFGVRMTANHNSCRNWVQSGTETHRLDGDRVTPIGDKVWTFYHSESPPPDSVPTLTQWGLIVFAGLFILSMIFMLRRKRAKFPLGA